MLARYPLPPKNQFQTAANRLGWWSVPVPTYKRASEVMEADVGNELVAFDVHTGDTFALNEVAASVWRSLSEPKSFNQLRDQLISDYDVPLEQCTNELEKLLEELTEKRLVQKTG